MSRLEKSIEAGFCNLATREGWWAVKLNVTGSRGIPDRVFLKDYRRVFFVEFKREGEKPRRLQSFIHSRLRNMGFAVYVVDNIGMAEAILRNENL